ncbi:ABC transporter ATP-binding protein [Phascolarctobacterium faecium]|uniref:ABC transporter ATP-binding protein n=1 Tax=Phascolarctobacterium faecium TaxID=33025 RepID=UPI0040284FD0
MALQIENISFGYDKNKKILNNISLSVNQGEVLGILGPNGTGKTTFIKCINHILSPDSGEILFDGQKLDNMTPKDIAKIIAYVPQYTGDFFAMNVIDAVMMGRLPYTQNQYSHQDRTIVFNILRQMQLENFAFRSIKAMSGGERQRVFIARALAQQPQCIILDEPTSSLDLHNQLFILQTITDLAKAGNISVIMTIHDLNLAAMFCDKILMLKDSHIFAYGITEDVLTEININAMYNVKTNVTMADGHKHIRLIK